MTGTEMAIDLHELVAKGLIIPQSEVSDDLKYNSIREWDSVAHMALIAELEDAYDIMLDTDDIVEMSSVGKIREILKKYDVDV
jgi:acyl carrier protein